MGTNVGRLGKLTKTGARSIALTVGVALGLGMVITTPQAGLAAETTSVLEITKSASKTELKPGEVMEYRIELGCSTISDLGCRGATLSDLIPAEFEIIPDSVSVSNAKSNPPVVEGNRVTVEFTDPLGDGSVGLVENADAVVTIQVRLREDLPYEANGKPIVNTATADAENAVEVSDVVEVVPVVEKKLVTEAEKFYNPTSGQAEPGSKTQLTVNGTNKSNAGVETLTLTDPTDPTASPNPFDLLKIATIDSLTFPEGAQDTATVEYFIDGEWVSEVLSASAMPHAPPGDAKGVRVTFTAADGSKIPTNAGGGFVLNLEQRNDVEELKVKTVVNNTVESEVGLGGDTAVADDEADYTILTEALSVQAEKSFSPNELIEGQQTTVTLKGTNTSALNLDTFSIREPASGDFAAELDFKKFTSKVQFPKTAQSGEITFVYLDKTGAEQTFTADLTDGSDFPALPADFGSLKHFQLDFTGPVEPGSSSEIKFTAEANEQAEPSKKVTNVVGVDGTAGSKPANDTAEADVTFSEKKLEIVTEKKLSPGEIWGYPGEGVLVQLPTTVVKPGSNVPANEIIVSDPALDSDGKPVDSSGFWDHFTPQAVTNTDVPAGATLTVRYWDTEAKEWRTIPGFDALTGVVTKDIPEEIRKKMGGIQFAFTKPDPGFEPHEAGEFNVNPSFTATLDEKYEGDKPLELANCATSSGSATTEGNPIEDVTDAPSCDDITVNAPVPGEYDLFDKNWVDAGNPAQIVQRSGDHATTRLHWSTENLTFDRMTLGETRLGKVPGAGPADAVADTTFEAFNLLTVKAVTKDTGFTKGWDMITAIDLWIDGAWVPAANATGLPFTKTMSDIELTADEQRDATAVRIVFEENREGRTSADAPAPGTGLTKSMGRDRKVDLEWELRDVRRSNPAKAVIASEIFNVAGEEGLVKNWGSATGEQPGGGVEHDQEDDDITIVPRPLGVTVSKGWSGGPLGVPALDVPASSYPTSRVTISAKNTSQQKIDQLTVVDPGEGKASPFEIFTLRSIVKAPHPVEGGDADKTLVVLTKSDGSIINPTGKGGATPGQAIAMTPAELADVVKIELRHEGRIVSGATATLQLDLQLRKTHRSDPSKPVTVVDSPVKNGTTASVTDLLGLEQEHSVDSSDDAQIKLDTFELGVLTTKKFTPDTQVAEILPGEEGYAEEDWAAISMELTGRPTGTARADKLVVTDSGANRTADAGSAESFWNAYRFEGFTGDTLAVPNPINRVQVDLLFGEYTFDEEANTLDFTADVSAGVEGWKAGTASPVTVKGGKVENAAATLLADIAPQDFDKVRGIRFTYTAVDSEGEAIAFENPANPHAKIDLHMKRRAFLVTPTDTPVPYTALPVAPGEPADGNGGVFTNTVDANVESFMKFPVAGSDDLLPLVASTQATTKIYYVDAGIEVAVEKTPLGAQAPGSVIPFKLKTTNTAVRVEDNEINSANAIGQPVIIDRLPVGTNGKPQLVFDPDMEESKRFSYELENRMAPATSVLPTNPTGVTVSYLDKDEKPVVDGAEPVMIKFEFPKGTNLYPGEVYTITANMMFRPGVLAGSENGLTNQFGVSSGLGEKFAGCNFETELDPQVDECGTTTEVYPTEAGALRGKKYVRANDNELGLADVPNPNAGLPHVPHFGDTDTGYFAGNSVPITKPLGKETWREEMQNTGTLAMDKVVTIDSLPDVGDQGAIVLLPRKSEWRPSWEGNIGVVTDTAPDGAKYRDDVMPTRYYSNSEDPACVADLKPTEQQCDAGYWQPLPDDLNAAGIDPKDVRHVKMVFEFPKGKELQPGERLAYTFETRTPAQAPKMTADTVAWNSIGVGAQTVSSDGQKRASVLPTEGLRVGVALATGPLSVLKTVVGEGAEGFAPDTFDLEVLCTVQSPDDPELKVALDPIGITVQADETYTLEQPLPFGARCTVQDKPGANGESSSEILGGTVSVGRDGEPVALLELENRYDLGSFTVAKTVDGAVNAAGDPQDYGSFSVATACTFQGEPLDLPVTETELTAGGPAWLVNNLPIGAICTFTETNSNGAAAQLTSGGTPLEENEDGSWTFEITNDAPDLQLQLENTFATGAIELTKKLEGDGVAALADDTKFTFDVLCTFEGETVYEDTVQLTKADVVAGKKHTITKLPAGAECGFTETDDGGATSATMTPEQPVVVEDGAKATFTAVNTFTLAAFEIVKQLEGDGVAALADDTTFTFDVLCTFEGEDVFTDTFEITKAEALEGKVVRVDTLPAGAKCGVTETGTGGATSSVVTPDTSEEPVLAGSLTEPVRFTAVNTYDAGALQVTKEIVGDGASLAADKTFTVALACSVDGGATKLLIPGGAGRELSLEGGLVASYEGLPVGAECELRETEAAGAASVTITPNSGDATVGTATVAADEVIELTVVNEFPLDPPVPPVDEGGEKPGDGDKLKLPGTGGELPLGWLFAGGGLVLLGAVLVVLRARRVTNE